MPIIPRSLDVQAADVLREEILNGTLTPGSRLLEIELSERLNLSRGTIRSALQQLTYEGLIVQFPYRGCAVVGLTSRDAWELYTLRNALECLAAKLSAQSMTANKAAILEAALQQLREAAKRGNWKEVSEEDFALHKTIIQLCEHRRLQEQYSVVEHQIKLYIASCNALNLDLDEIVRQHESLVEAICSGNIVVAEKIAGEHNTDGQLLVEHLHQLEKTSQVAFP
ncbi:MAG: GntR family transcriptional regulator [Hydrococcus sp. Prado102]|nr:GntR family transcriptional regulator [Hydrococcus sp. Prado102]